MMRSLIALTLLLAGCSPALTFRVDPAATPEQRGAVASSIADWNVHTNAKHKLRLDASGDYLVYFPPRIQVSDGPDADNEPDLAGGRECTHRGKDCPIAPSIAALREYTGARLLQVLRHELGHALGIKHIDEDGALMGGPGRAKAEDITDRDITECRRVGACTGAAK